MNLYYDDPLELLALEDGAIDLDRVHMLNARILPADNHPVITFFQELAERIFSRLLIASKGYNARWKMIALINILLNLFIAFNNDQVVAYSRFYNHYLTVHHKYGFQWYTYTNYKQVIDGLINEGLVYHKTGFYDNETNTGKRSRIWAGEELAAEFNALQQILNENTEIRQVCLNDNSFDVLVNSNVARRVEPQCSIILKDKMKHWIQYVENKHTRLFAEQLSRYNELMSDTTVLVNSVVYNQKCSNMSVTSPIPKYCTVNRHSTLCITPHPYPAITSLICHNHMYYKELHTQLFRVFNRGNFNCGGRYYNGEYQALNDEERSQLLINGYPVREADFDALHARMLYHLLGKDINSDPYDLFNGDKSLRKAVKLMLNMAINARDARAAMNAFRKMLYRKYSNPLKMEKMDKLRLTMKTKGFSINDLYNLILESHPDIQRFISSDMGVQLQNIDSSIATDVLNYFTGRNITCLCVHDSFVVPKQYGNDLKDVMQETYKRHMHFDCPVSFK